jgi:hypothetical protein
MHAEENTDPADLATLEAVRLALVETFEAGFIVVCREEGGKTVWSKVEFGNAFALGKLAEDYAGGCLVTAEELAAEDAEVEDEED